MDISFSGTFTDEDWEHTTGGIHVFVEDGSAIVSHAAVVERALLLDEVPLRTGYVEGVATHPHRRRRGHAATVMRKVNEIISSSFELGALSTEVPELYLQHAWERWHGPTYVAAPAGRVRTQDEDGGIMVLRTELTPPLALSESLTCDPRSGDAW